MEFFLSNSKYTLPYRIYGKGNRALFAFHGFGRTGEDFHVFEKDLGAHFTIYAFDLPYHGTAKVNDSFTNHAFTGSDLLELLHLFSVEKKIENFSVMGYSLGGKIALGCISLFSSRIENIYLLAPDGLKVNPFYFIGTRTLIGRYLFKSIILRPGILFKTGNFLEKIKWLNPKINYFVKHHMDTIEKRRQVYNVWVLFRKFNPDLLKTATIINKNEIVIWLFMGKFDSVIPTKLGNKLIKVLRNKNALYLLDCGHKVMEKHKTISEIILISQ